jgi:hypothetical protein
MLTRTSALVFALLLALPSVSQSIGNFAYPECASFDSLHNRYLVSSNRIEFPKVNSVDLCHNCATL